MGEHQSALTLTSNTQKCISASLSGLLHYALSCAQCRLPLSTRRQTSTTNRATKLKWRKWVKKTGKFSFSLKMKAFNTRTRRYNRGWYYNRYYRSSSCRKFRAVEVFSRKFYTYKCKMCRRNKRRQLFCLNSRLEYTRRCWKRRWGHNNWLCTGARNGRIVNKRY